MSSSRSVMRGSLASLDALPGSTVLDTTDQEDIVESEDRSHATFRGNIIFLILYLVLRSDLI